jgi:hypothetical protein
MPDDRPGGPVVAQFEGQGGEVVLRFSDASSGGGMVLHVPSPAWAQAWLDDLGVQLADLEHDGVFG